MSNWHDRLATVWDNASLKSLTLDWSFYQRPTQRLPVSHITIHERDEGISISLLIECKVNVSKLMICRDRCPRQSSSFASYCAAITHYNLRSLRTPCKAIASHGLSNTEKE